MKLIICGDVLPQECNIKQFENEDIPSIVSNTVEERLKSADIVLCNLEGPLTESDNPIVKSGPCIKSSAASAAGLKKLGIKYVSLANNHIMDYGDEGLKSTIKALDQNNIGYFGAGENIQQARKPLKITCDGVKIGIYSCAEYEFTIADDGKPGANVFDALYVLDDISQLKKDVDYLVVLYHGSKEYYRYPVPYVQNRCRKMIDKGADLVLCQHSHCIGAKEQWNNGEILYGQGNFILNRKENEYNHSGLMVEVSLTKKERNIKYIPVVRNGARIEEPNEPERTEILDSFNKRSEESKSKEFTAKEYSRFAAQKREYYYDQICPDNLLFRIIRKLFGKKINRRVTGTNKANLINVLRCEAHRDLFIKALLDETYKK